AQRRLNRHPPRHPRPPAGVDPPRPPDVAVVHPPEDLRPRVDPLHRRPALVHPLELRGRARDRREAPEVQRVLHSYDKTILPPLVAALLAAAAPALVPRRAAVFQSLPILFIAD